MIIIHGELEIGSGSDDAFVSLVRELVEKTRAEEGCHAYAFTRDLDDPGLFRIVEEWEDEDALASHMRSDHYRAFGKELGNIEVKRMSLVQYRAGERTVLA